MALSIAQTLQGNEQTPAQLAESRRDARFHLYQGANSLEDVLGVVPSDYRDCLRDPLREVQAVTHRMTSCRTTVAKWEALKQAGQVPTQYRLKPVDVQYCKDFKDSAVVAARNAASALAHTTFVNKLFHDDLDVKKQELEHLRSLLAPRSVAECLLAIVKVKATEVSARSLRPVL
jgi:hypothetical protein